MSTPAMVLLDDDDPCLSSYPELPEGWTVEIGRRAGLSEIYNRAFKQCPDEEWYGVLCDDAVPVTDWFDLRLIEAVKGGMAVPSGGEATGGSPHFVLDGDLIREMGWIAFPGLDRLYIDTIWKDITQSIGTYRFLPDVVVEHHHFSNGLALFDATYRKPNKERDRKIYEDWKSSK